MASSFQAFSIFSKSLVKLSDASHRKSAVVVPGAPSGGGALLWAGLLSVVRLAGGVLAGHDLVDALSEAAVGGQPPRRLPQLLHAALLGAAHREGLGVFHWEQSTTWKNIQAGPWTLDPGRARARARAWCGPAPGDLRQWRLDALLWILQLLMRRAAALCRYTAFFMMDGSLASISAAQIHSSKNPGGGTNMEDSSGHGEAPPPRGTFPTISTAPRQPKQRARFSVCILQEYSWF